MRTGARAESLVEGATMAVRAPRACMTTGRLGLPAVRVSK